MRNFSEKESRVWPFREYYHLPKPLMNLFAQTEYQKVCFCQRFMSKNKFSTFQTIFMEAILFAISQFLEIIFWKYFLASFKKIHIRAKCLILPLQNVSDFHIKIKMC